MLLQHHHKVALTYVMDAEYVVQLAEHAHVPKLYQQPHQRQTSLSNEYHHVLILLNDY